MITLRKTVSLSLDIKDLNDAVILFLKEKGYEPFDKVSIENLQKIIDGGEMILDAREINNVEASSRIAESPVNDDKIVTSFPASMISRIGKSTRGLEMFLGNVDTEQVQQILKRSFYSLGNLDKNFLIFMFSLNSPNPELKKAKSKDEIEEYFQTTTKLVVGNVINNFGRCAMNEFEMILSQENKVLAKLKPNINLAKDDLLKLNLEDLVFSHHTREAFRIYEYNNKQFSLKTVGDLIILDFNNFRRGRQVGEKTVQEVQNFIQLYELNS